MYDDFLARILEPDIFLPSQFYGTGGLSRQLEGEETHDCDPEGRCRVPGKISRGSQ